VSEGRRALSPRTLTVIGVAGVLVLALGGRSGVAALSPISDQVELDVPLDGIWLALVGAIPPIAYAVAALLTPRLVRRTNLEVVALGVAAVTGAAHIFRGYAPNYLGLFFGTVVLMLGVGVLNVILPGLVKLYAPARIGLLTSLYSTMMAISTAVPPAVGLLLANEFGWRLSLASWGVVSLLAIAPYAVLLPIAISRSAEEKRVAPVDAPQGSVRVGRSASARAIMLAFAVSGFTAYTVFAVLPKILTDHAGISVELAAIALTTFSIMGMPMSLVIPNLAVRPGWSGRLVVFAAISGAIGFLGLAFAPGLWPLLWTVLIALNTLTFSMSLALIGARTATHQMATELSGYVNTVGYLIAAIGPVVVGAVHEITDSWFVPLIVLAIFATVLLPAAAVLAKERTIEDELRDAGI